MLKKKQTKTHTHRTTNKYSNQIRQWSTNCCVYKLETVTHVLYLHQTICRL